MTFWEAAGKAFDWLSDRMTRILGLASGTLATLAATDIVPANQLKYYMAAIAVLTYWRGQSNAAVVAQAKAVVKDPSTASDPTVTNLLKEYK